MAARPLQQQTEVVTIIIIFLYFSNLNESHNFDTWSALLYELFFVQYESRIIIKLMIKSSQIQNCIFFDRRSAYVLIIW